MRGAEAGAVHQGADFNGDGRPDLAVGAPRVGDHAGAVHVYLGTDHGLPAEPGVNLDVPSTAPRGGFGEAVANAGDINADGYDDLVVGAPGTYGDRTGRVYVYYGGPGGLPSAPSVALAGPDGPADLFGGSVAGLGDVNGDGFGDLVVGAADVGDYTGRAYVYLGGAGGVSAVPSQVLDSPAGAGGGFGLTVVGAGDLDGDGHPDLAVAAPSVVSGDRTAGRVYVFRGGRGGVATLPCATLAGAEGVGAGLGYALSGAGDVNGDGYSDLVAGAPSAEGFAGRAYLYLGSPSGVGETVVTLTAPGTAEHGRFGLAVAGVGDVNGDGYADVAVGEPGSTAVALGEGRVHVFLGGPNGPGARPDASFGLPGVPLAQFGWAVAGVGDVDGDGYADLAAGAPNASERRGTAVMFYGSACGIAAERSLRLAGVDGSESEFGLTLGGAR